MHLGPAVQNRLFDLRIRLDVGLFQYLGSLLLILIQTCLGNPEHHENSEDKPHNPGQKDEQ